MYANVRGIKGKATDLEQKLISNDINVATIVETKLGTIPPRIEGYTWITKNKQAGSGGVAILIKDRIKGITKTPQNLEESETETLWIELGSKPKPTFVGVVYGKQETAPIEEIERQFETWTTHILTLKQKGKVILTGDFNAKIKVQKTNFDGTTVNQKTSRNGKFMEKMMKDTGMTPISTNSDMGLWTRVNTKNKEEKSIIDYILIQKEDIQNCVDIEVDEQETNKITGENKTDHNTIFMTYDTRMVTKEERRTTWKLGNKEGWQAFNTALQERDKEEKIKTYEDLQEITLKLIKQKVGEKIMKPTKHRKSEELKKACEEKMKAKREFKDAIRNKASNVKEKLDKYTKAQENVRRIGEEEQRKILEDKYNRFISEGGTKSQTFWKIRKSIMKQGSLEYDHITEDGEMVTDPTKAKQSIAQYFENLYQAREAEPEEQQRSECIIKSNKDMASKTHQIREEDKITMKEMKKTIRKLKRRKAAGPDKMPNEVLMEADDATLEIYTRIFNTILQNKQIPMKWREGSITKIYKGKGEKGKCSNERGITVSSNIGKVYERIINDRSLEKVNITHAQAGGKKGTATTDHLLILKETIRHHRENGNEIHLAFLDVTKAYDKAWLEGIMYVLSKHGVNNYLWEIIKDLNTNLTATVNTKHGQTEKFPIKDSIRQGGVLSVMMYALLMDEIAKRIEKRNKGVQIPNSNKQIGCLLWMDDVVLIHNTHEGLQDLLDITDNIAKKYHIAFGRDKSKAMHIGKKSTKHKVKDRKLQLGNMEVDYTDQYKYLGEILNERRTMESQIPEIKKKTEAAFQTIMVIAGDKNLRKVKMEIVWKLLETCIKPIILYACETWCPTKKDVQELNRIYDKILKRILKVPTSTPREVLYLETKNMDIEHTWENNQILMYHRLLTTENETLEAMMKNPTEKSWAEKTRKLIYNYTDEPIHTMRKGMAKQHIKKKIQQKMTEEMENMSNTKSKVKYYTEGNILTNGTKRNNKRPKYMEVLTRNEVSMIFRARTRMIHAKANYKNMHKETKCRGCGAENETQEHILEECTGIHENNEENKITKEELFNNMLDTDQLRKLAGKIQKIEEKIMKMQ